MWRSAGLFGAIGSLDWTRQRSGIVLERRTWACPPFSFNRVIRGNEISHVAICLDWDGEIWAPCKSRRSHVMWLKHTVHGGGGGGIGAYSDVIPARDQMDCLSRQRTSDDSVPDGWIKGRSGGCCLEWLVCPLRAMVIFLHRLRTSQPPLSVRTHMPTNTRY